MAAQAACLRCGRVCDETSFLNHSPCYRGYRETVLQLHSCHHPWPHEVGFPPGEVVIDRSWPLVVLPDSTLPNLVAVSESSSALMPSSNDDATLINLEQQRSESSGAVGRGQDDSQDHQDGRLLATSHHRWPFAGLGDSAHPINHVAVSESSFGRRACENDDATLINLEEQTGESSVVVGRGRGESQEHQDAQLLATSHHRWPFARLGDSAHPINHVAVSESSVGRRACENDDATLINLEEMLANEGGSSHEIYK